MGNYYCKKCGINRDYYPPNYDNKSCRIHDEKYEDFMKKENYYHRWEWKIALFT